MLAAVAGGVRFRPMRLLFAYLHERSEEKAFRWYAADQLWAINAAWRKEWAYPRYEEIIGDRTDEKAQRESDEREKKKVYEWLMGGEDL